MWGPEQGGERQLWPSGGQRKSSYLDMAKPCLSSCRCRSARKIPASTFTCFFFVSTCKTQHRLGGARPPSGPWSPVRRLWNVSIAILACGQLEPLLSLNGGTEPKNAGDTGEKVCLRNRILVWSPGWPQRRNPLVPAFQAEGLQMHASVPCFWSQKASSLFCFVSGTPGLCTCWANTLD